jgi:hypothetical protein
MVNITNRQQQTLHEIQSREMGQKGPWIHQKLDQVPRRSDHPLSKADNRYEPYLQERNSQNQYVKNELIIDMKHIR